LQTSETGQQLEVSADALETASSEIADAVSAVGSPDVANEDRSDDELQSIADCVESALDEIDSIL
jgi:hypothetical protein